MEVDLDSEEPHSFGEAVDRAQADCDQAYYCDQAPVALVRVC